MKRILLVEDREDDVLLFQHALKQSGHSVHLDVALDGDEAICFLEKARSTAYTAECRVPDLVILDIRMPRVNGFEVLRWIRAQMQFLAIPVIMYSTSDRRDEMLKASNFGANSYVGKTGDLERFGKMLGILLTYWLEIHRPVPAK